MKFSSLCLAAIISSSLGVYAEEMFCTADCSPPYIGPQMMIGGELTTNFESELRARAAQLNQSQTQLTVMEGMLKFAKGIVPEFAREK